MLIKRGLYVLCGSIVIFTIIGVCIVFVEQETRVHNDVNKKIITSTVADQEQKIEKTVSGFPLEAPPSIKFIWYSRLLDNMKREVFIQDLKAAQSLEASIVFPSDFTISNLSNSFGLGKIADSSTSTQAVVTLEMPVDRYYPRSALSRNTLTIIASKDPEIVAQCRKPVPAFEVKREKINGIEFFTFVDIDGGMEGVQLSTVRYTEYKNTCFELLNYKWMTRFAKEKGLKDVENSDDDMKNIIQTFKFVEEQS